MTTATVADSGASSDTHTGSLTAWALTVYSAMFVWFFVVANMTTRALGVRPRTGPGVEFPGVKWFGHLLRWDGGWYLNIAESGYSFTPDHQSNVAFFPAYPNMMRLVHLLTHDMVWAGIAVTFVAGAAGSVLVTKWCKVKGMSRRATVATLLVMVCYPYSWYLFGVVYSDALFVAAVVGAFILVERDRHVLAGLVGIVASADRPTGLAVIVGLMAVACEHSGVFDRTVSHDAAVVGSWFERFSVPNRVHWKKLTPRLLGVALSSIGAGSFMLYLWYRFGDPLLFVNIQKTWGQGGGWNTLLKESLFHDIETGWRSTYVRTNLAQGFFMLCGFVSIPWVGRRFGWGYSLFVGALLFMPLYGARDFQGTGRYMLALVPVTAIVGEWLASRTRMIQIGWLTISSLLLTLMMVGFTHGIYLA